jgi:hypothetical protein
MDLIRAEPLEPKLTLTLSIGEVKIDTGEFAAVHWNRGSMMHDGTSPCDLAFQAEGGDPEAQYQLGVLFLLGDQVEQDPDAAYRWLAKAASLEHAGAQSLAGKVAPWRASVARSEGFRHAREWKKLKTISPLTLFGKLRTQAETVLERGRKILPSIRSRQLAARIGVFASIRDSFSTVRRKAVQSLHPS